MDAQLAEQTRFLKEIGAEDAQHSHTSLLAHLAGVRKLLGEWGARPALVEAGLFHSVYGTEYFALGTVELEKRSKICALIGAEAEEIVHLWCTIRRESLSENLNRSAGFTAVDRNTGEQVSLTAERLEDLITLWCADTCEQISRMEGATTHQGTLFSLRRLGLQGAQSAISEALEPFLVPEA